VESGRLITRLPHRLSRLLGSLRNFSHMSVKGDEASATGNISTRKGAKSPTVTIKLRPGPMFSAWDYPGCMMFNGPRQLLQFHDGEERTYVSHYKFNELPEKVEEKVEEKEDTPNTVVLQEVEDKELSEDELLIKSLTGKKGKKSETGKKSGIYSADETKIRIGDTHKTSSKFAFRLLDAYPALEQAMILRCEYNRRDDLYGFEEAAKVAEKSSESSSGKEENKEGKVDENEEGKVDASENSKNQRKPLKVVIHVGGAGHEVYMHPGQIRNSFRKLWSKQYERVIGYAMLPSGVGPDLGISSRFGHSQRWFPPSVASQRQADLMKFVAEVHSEDFVSMNSMERENTDFASGKENDKDDFRGNDNDINAGGINENNSRILSHMTPEGIHVHGLSAGGAFAAGGAGLYYKDRKCTEDIQDSDSSESSSTSNLHDSSESSATSNLSLLLIIFKRYHYGFVNVGIKNLNS
jgi:hypothetical protein